MPSNSLRGFQITFCIDNKLKLYHLIFRNLSLRYANGTVRSSPLPTALEELPDL